MMHILITTAILFGLMHQAPVQCSAPAASAAPAPAPKARILLEKSTQTEISAQDDEQVKAQVTVFMKSADKEIVNATQGILQRIASSKDVDALTNSCTIKKFMSMLETNQTADPSPDTTRLFAAGLLEDKNAHGHHYVKKAIREAYQAEGHVKR